LTNEAGCGPSEEFGNDVRRELESVEAKTAEVQDRVRQLCKSYEKEVEREIQNEELKEIMPEQIITDRYKLFSDHINRSPENDEAAGLDIEAKVDLILRQIEEGLPDEEPKSDS